MGLAPTTSGVLGLPLMQAMRTRYPDVRLHMVESMSGHLTAMLHARELDLAVLFDTRLHQAQQATGARRCWRRTCSSSAPVTEGRALATPVAGSCRKPSPSPSWCRSR